MASEVIRIGESRSRAPRSTSAAAERLALLLLQVLAVVDQQDPVAGGDPEDGEEADQRAERDDAAGDPGGQHAADQRHRQREEDQRRRAASCGTRPAAAAGSQPGDDRRARAAGSAPPAAPAYSPSSSAWYPRAKLHRAPASVCSSLTTEPRSRPSTLPPTSSRPGVALRGRWRSGWAAARPSATSPSRTWSPGRRVDRQVLDAGHAVPGRSGCSRPRRRRPCPARKMSPTSSPATSVAAARRTSPGLRPYFSAWPG